ncbi:MAG: hypothetical protein GC148_11925 [Hyphomonas sp.]|nr:hypothetical protein [Hyphomonas sp.]
MDSSNDAIELDLLMNQTFQDNPAQVEAELFAAHPGPSEAACVFILGAPRTGSTLFYQAFARALGLACISNRANAETPLHPAVGILASYRARRAESMPEGFESRFGKTEGRNAPSEGSAIFANWCGGGHPSEEVSAGLLPGRSVHFRRTLSCIEAATGGPLLAKNAWNCFRVKALAEAAPRSAFIWIRRDAAAAAVSDLAARYTVQGDPRTWNSATPRNVEALRQLSPAAQVLENQFEFSRAVSEAGDRLAPGRFASLWYEDFLDAPDAEVERIVSNLSILRGRLRAGLPQFSAPRPVSLSEEDQRDFDAHLARDPARWAGLAWRGRG